MPLLSDILVSTSSGAWLRFLGTRVAEGFLVPKDVCGSISLYRVSGFRG